ncbi:hypothetical protein BAU01nite_06750 [Brevibacterium aurantiacum]|nr:hypothetical protein BAU01nite_06750 [Brevibacterium aurantiacum]
MSGDPEDVEVPDDLEITIWDESTGYRTCADCGRDCPPEPFDAGEGQGIRIAFACPTHGVHSVVDPFEGKR